MIIVDDHLAGAVLVGHRQMDPGHGPTSTTWGFHYRLLRALSDRRTTGSLTRGNPTLMLRIVSDPSRHGVEIVDPRSITAVAATLAIEHRLNLLTAELLAAAQVHEAAVVLTEGNVGRRWPGLFDELGLRLTIV